jgi:GNAT superfamily N-acetyltransferase
VIAPPYRGHGIAAQLLDRVIEDAPSRGVRWVEAYPGGAHRGPRAMFDARGFEVFEERAVDTVMRRRL